jgi:hypothetical protein
VADPRYQAAAAAQSPHRGIDSPRAQRQLFGARPVVAPPINYAGAPARLAAGAYRGGPAIQGAPSARRFAGLPVRRIFGAGPAERRPGQLSANAARGIGDAPAESGVVPVSGTSTAYADRPTSGDGYRRLPPE